jgi:high-affinity iron transporter
MIASAIILFRELFEIVLIVGIILAATRTLNGRKKWIIGGITAGVIGSALIAVFANSISEFAQGVGQEIFNACILLVAAIFIGWTVLWMSQHGKHMHAQFTQLSAQIHNKQTTFISLAVVIALAMWREGSEIVLFSYGMIASGQSYTDLALGALIGGISGATIGYATYRGLISLPYKYYLRTTSILLIFLVAGMLSQLRAG